MNGSDASDAVSGKSGSAAGSGRLFRRGVVVLVVLALALRWAQIDRRSLWTDELTTLEVVRLPWSEIAANRLAAGHFPTYFWALKAWTNLFGESHLALRSPSLLLNIAALVLLVLYARRWAGDAPALAAGLLFALHQRGIWAALEARPYSAAIFFVIASQYALLRIMTGSGIAWFAFYIGASAAAVFTHLAAGPVILFQLPVVLFAWRRTGGGKRNLAVLGAVLAVGVLTLAAFAVASRHGHADRAKQAGAPSLKFLLDAFAQLFIGEYKFLGGSSLKYPGALIGVWALAIVVRGRRWGNGKRGGCGLGDGGLGEGAIGHGAVGDAFTIGLAQSLAWLFSSLAALSVLFALGSVGETFRYFTPSVAAAAAISGVAVAESLAGKSHRKPRRVFAFLCVLAVAAVGCAYSASRGDGLDRAVDAIRDKARADEVVFVCNDAHADTMFRYYGPVAAPIVPVDRDEKAPAALTSLIAARTGNAPGFWLFLYKDSGSPLLKCARGLSPQFKEESGGRIGEVRLCHFTKP